MIFPDFFVPTVIQDPSIGFLIDLQQKKLKIFFYFYHSTINTKHTLKLNLCDLLVLKTILHQNPCFWISESSILKCHTPTKSFISLLGESLG